MEVISPTWNPKESAYTFRFQIPSDDGPYVIHSEAVFLSTDLSGSQLELPVIPDQVLQTILHQFIEQTKQWFTTPLGDETVKKRLRHTIDRYEVPHTEGWFIPTWKPASIKASRSQFVMTWALIKMTPTQPKISADFLLGSSTPRAQSPEQPSAEELRTIQIQDTLVPVGDLPLSDLPPLSFYTETDTDRQLIRQKIREARLRVALAKLKAQRMEQRYYERYGETPMESEESSELSSESDSGDEPLGRQTYS